MEGYTKWLRTNQDATTHAPAGAGININIVVDVPRCESNIREKRR